MTAAFEQVIALQVAQLDREAAKQHHIAVARAGLAAFLARQTVKPGVTIEVDGHAAASEDSVKPYGVITYRFARMREIAAFALGHARALSPVGQSERDKHKGLYKQSWFFLVKDAETTLEAIPQDAAVILTNDQPFARKIHTRAKGFEKYGPPGIVEKVRQLVIRKYGNQVDVEIEFITLAGGYVIQGNQKTALAQLNRKSSVFRAGGTRLSRRKDLRPGAAMTYPALVITPKRFV